MTTEPTCLAFTANTFQELIQALQSRGLSLAQISRSPFRIDGVWHCEVKA